MRFSASVKYDGSKYYGFQRLPNQKTVQGELEKVLTKINKAPVDVKGAGRTDRGVHAYNQVVHFDLDINIDERALKSAINSILDDGIHINYCEIVSNEFHARFDAQEKIYEYVINLGEYDPLVNDYMFNYNHQLNISQMKKASRYLLGLNSYKSFVSGVREKYDSVIYKVTLKKVKDILVIRFNGKNFYNHMVRNLVGALVLVGEGKASPEVVKEMIIKEENIYHYITLPANGLYLVNIKY